MNDDNDNDNDAGVRRSSHCSYSKFSLLNYCGTTINVLLHPTHTVRKHRSLLKPCMQMHCIGDTHFEVIVAFVDDEQRIYTTRSSPNGDQAVRRPHMLWSICGRRFTTPLFVVRGIGTPRPWVAISSPLTHGYLLPLSSYLAGSKAFPPARATRIRWQIPL